MVDKKNNSNFVYISLVAIVAIVAVVVLLSGTGQRNAIMTDDMLAADANIGGQASYSKYAQKALPTKQEILPPKTGS